jgi:hypothetical protein
MAAGVTDGQFRTVGVLELLGAASLVLPTVLGIAPALVPLAGVGLALTMVGAIVTHVRLGETDRVRADRRSRTCAVRRRRGLRRLPPLSTP